MTKSSRVPALDGIRGIAIMAVMLLHAAIAYFPGGGIGVDVFFALSAFLITTILLGEHEETGQVSFKGFYARRALRLGPALILFLAFLAPVTAIVDGNVAEIPSSTVASLLYVENYAFAYGWMPIGPEYAHIWSLSVEEQFYIIWPAVLLFLTRRWQPRLVPILAAMFTAGVLLQFYTSGVDYRAYFMPWGHFIPILGGCLMAALIARQGDRPWPWWFRQVTSTPIAVAVLAGFATAIFVMDRLPWRGPTLAFAACGFGAVLLVGHVVTRSRGPVVGLLSTAPLVWLGTRSYGLYLYHRTLAMLFPALIPSLTLKTSGPLVLVVSLAVAEVSFRFVEKPIQRWGRERMAARAAASSGATTARAA